LNAIYNAIGVRVDEIPATPEKVLAALYAKEAETPLQTDRVAASSRTRGVASAPADGAGATGSGVAS
ncbi:MAG TPA: hypothetical protein VMV44_15065, partial [Rectinemataceae bacterium]|nr:hypothetical protein [Rectinemataceae bacterium]